MDQPPVENFQLKLASDIPLAKMGRLGCDCESTSDSFPGFPAASMLPGRELIPVARFKVSASAMSARSRGEKSVIIHEIAADASAAAGWCAVTRLDFTDLSGELLVHTLLLKLGAHQRVIVPRRS